MARINQNLLDSESVDYLSPMNVNNISGNLLDEVVHDYCQYIDKEYPSFGQLMNDRYHFCDDDLPYMPYSEAYHKIQNEYVQQDW